MESFGANRKLIKMADIITNSEAVRRTKGTRKRDFKTAHPFQK